MRRLLLGFTRLLCASVLAQSNPAVSVTASRYLQEPSCQEIEIAANPFIDNARTTLEGELVHAASNVLDGVAAELYGLIDGDRNHPLSTETFDTITEIQIARGLIQINDTAGAAAQADLLMDIDISSCPPDLAAGNVSGSALGDEVIVVGPNGELALTSMNVAEPHEYDPRSYQPAAGHAHWKFRFTALNPGEIPVPLETTMFKALDSTNWLLDSPFIFQWKNEPPVQPEFGRVLALGQSQEYSIFYEVPKASELTQVFVSLDQFATQSHPTLNLQPVDSAPHLGDHVILPDACAEPLAIFSVDGVTPTFGGIAGQTLIDITVTAPPDEPFTVDHTLFQIYSPEHILLPAGFSPDIDPDVAFGFEHREIAPGSSFTGSVVVEGSDPAYVAIAAPFAEVRIDVGDRPESNSGENGADPIDTLAPDDDDTGQ